MHIIYRRAYIYALRSIHIQNKITFLNSNLLKSYKSRYIYIHTYVFSYMFFLYFLVYMKSRTLEKVRVKKEKHVKKHNMPSSSSGPPSNDVRLIPYLDECDAPRRKRRHSKSFHSVYKRL